MEESKVAAAPARAAGDGVSWSWDQSPPENSQVSPSAFPLVPPKRIAAPRPGSKSRIAPPRAEGWFDVGIKVQIPARYSQVSERYVPLKPPKSRTAPRAGSYVMEALERAGGPTPTASRVH